MKTEKALRKDAKVKREQRNNWTIFIILMLTVLSLPSNVSADWREFIPRPYENGADIDVIATYESDDNKMAGNGLKWSDTFIKEKLTLHSIGYIYHPRFVQYQLSLSGALKQEDFTVSSSESGHWRNATGIEYDAKLFVLPEHPYNLKLFISRIEPLFREQLATQSNNVETSKGAVFRYRRKPYFVDVRYIEDNFESSSSSTDVKTLGADVSYFKRYTHGNQLIMGGSFARSSFSSTGDLTGDTNIYSLFNTIDLQTAVLNSNLSKDTSNQEDPVSGTFESDHLLWQERLNVKLPLRFKTELIYRYQKNDFTSKFTSGGMKQSSTRNLSSTDNRVDFNLQHNLYESLGSMYSFSHDSLTSDTVSIDSRTAGETDTTGKTDTTVHSLTSNYTKTIPWGRLLAGISVSRVTTDSSGSAAAIGENHPVNVPGSFVLNSSLVDEASINVFVRDPLPPSELVPLILGVHYDVTPFGNSFQINVFNLPSQFVIPKAFDFVVNYSNNTNGDFKLRTDAFGYNMSLDLFNNTVNPYYNYLVVRSKVLSGNFPGVPVDSTLNALGIIFQKGPFRALAEYQNYDANINPYTRWKGEVTFVTAVAETMNVRALASYENTDYPQGTGVTPGQGYSQRTATFSGNIQKQFPRQNLSISGGGSYAYQWGLTQGPYYSANGSVLWNIGKLALSLGANIYGADSEITTTANPLKTKRMHQYYYFKLKRKIF